MNEELENERNRSVDKLVILCTTGVLLFLIHQTASCAMQDSENMLEAYRVTEDVRTHRNGRLAGPND